MSPSVNPKPPFTSCSLASGDTSASSAGSSLTTAGLSPCACAPTAQTPRVVANRIAEEIDDFFKRVPIQPQPDPAFPFRGRHRNLRSGYSDLLCTLRHLMTPPGASLGPLPNWSANGPCANLS